MKNSSLLLQKYFLPFVLLIFALKFINLNADPPILKQPVDLYDEAWWAGNARLKILTDHWTFGDYSGGIAVAPLNSAITFLSFKIFGINQPAIRMVPLIASFIILVLLFLLLKKKDIQLAKLSVLLLSCNYTFWIYSRIGHLEMTMMVFLLMTFIFLIKENYIAYFLASVSLFLAFLLKFSALVFYPVVLVYLIFKLKSRATTFKKIIVFILSHSCFFLCFYFFFYQKHLSEFQNYLVHLHGKLTFLQQINLLNVAQKIIFLPLNDFFTEPSVCILTILALTGLIKGVDHKTFFKKELFLRNEAIVIGVIWMLAYIPGLFFTDYTPRRFNLLLIPLTILAANSILFFDSKENGYQFKKYVLVIAIFFLLFPVTGLHLNFHLLSFLPRSWFEGLTTEQANEKIISVLILIFLVVFFVAAVSGKLISKEVKILKFSLWIFLSILILNTLMIVNNRFELEMNRIMLLIIASPFILISYKLAFINNHTHIMLLLSSYFIISGVLITHDLIYPTFTREDASTEIQKIVGNEKSYAILLHNGWDVALKTNLLPLYYSVEEVKHLPVKSLSGIRPGYFISSSDKNISMEYFNDELNFAKSHHNARAVLIKEFQLFPVKNIARENLFFYKLNYND